MQTMQMTRRAQNVHVALVVNVSVVVIVVIDVSVQSTKAKRNVVRRNVMEKKSVATVSAVMRVVVRRTGASSVMTVNAKMMDVVNVITVSASAAHNKIHSSLSRWNKTSVVKYNRCKSLEISLIQQFAIVS